MNDTPTAKTDTPTLLRQLCQALDDKKAGDLKVMRVSEQSSITDYLVIATGTSEPHLRALRVELEKVIDQAGARILGMDTGDESGWIVIDAIDIMVHVFTGDNRAKYGLENLWKDAEELSLEEVYTGVKPVEKTAAEPRATKKAASKKKPASKKTVAKKAAPKGKTAKKSAKKAAVKKAPAKKASPKKAGPKKKTATKKKR